MEAAAAAAAAFKSTHIPTSCIQSISLPLFSSPPPLVFNNLLQRLEITVWSGQCMVTVSGSSSRIICSVHCQVPTMRTSLSALAALALGFLLALAVADGSSISAFKSRKVGRTRYSRAEIDAPAPSSSSDIAYQQSFLEPHNAARAKKSLPPLSWDSVLEDYARYWGNHQRDTDNCNLVHSNNEYGENLFWGPDASFNAGDAMWTWTNEEKYYDYATNSCQSGQMCGHYTQVVWNSTTHLGCATVNCLDSSVFIICSYNPPGNFVGQRPY